MSASPNAQDVADALAMTLEREDATGAPWCPPGDAAALRKWVADRSASLGTGIRRAIRLARLMALADGRADYIRFLYERLGSLRPRLFRQILERAAKEGRLPNSIAMLTPNGVHLREPALVPPDAPSGVFEIDFAQMPRLAALLDILHNAMGFTVVADLLSPLLPKAGAPKSSADEVGRAVQAAFNAWLGERLESTTHIAQAQQMRGFIVGRGRLAPEMIDDEMILLFWIHVAEMDEAQQIEGFRLYRSAAAAMLRYRSALRDALAARHLEEALGRGLAAANDDFSSDQIAARGEAWRSPLRALTLLPASRVKWLTAREQQQLRNYLGGPGDDAEDGAPEQPENPNDAWKVGLAGEERFDLAHWMTLLRADVFGVVQASIVGRLRKRADPQTAVAQAMETLDAAAYASSGDVYADARTQLHLESLAALVLLMEAGAAEAAILLRWLGGDAALRTVLGPTRRRPTLVRDDDDDDQNDDAADKIDDADELRARVAPRLRAAVADPNVVEEGAGRTLLLEALAARRKVNRAGFRREDRADSAVAMALRYGAAAVFEVIGELDRLTGTLSAKASLADLAADTARFATTFRRIYLGVGER
ncbi:MAG TPA: hypothetical protein VGG01_12330 [Xanthobacteraceae bacterium]|jgi:hypothetical protein